MFLVGVVVAVGEAAVCVGFVSGDVVVYVGSDLIKVVCVAESVGVPGVLGERSPGEVLGEVGVRAGGGAGVVFAPMVFRGLNLPEGGSAFGGFAGAFGIEDFGDGEGE